MKIKVLTLDGGKSAGDVELNDAVFGVEPAADILHRVVTWQLEKRRAPASATRERSEVARTGKKFGRQKGAVRLVTAIAALRSSSAAVRRMVSALACSVIRSTRRSAPWASRWRFPPRPRAARSR